MSNQINTRKKVQKEVNKLAGTVYRHSSFLAYQEGVVRYKEVGTHCYSTITYYSEKLSQVFLFFVKPDDNQRMWADYIINRSIFAPAFLTKDVEEGFELGFEVNTFAEFGLMKGGMIALRHAFEFDSWDFKGVVDMGFSETEAYALVSKYVDDEGELDSRRGNTNHMIFDYDAPYEAYEGKYYVPEFGGGTSLEEGNHRRFKVTLNKTFCNCHSISRKISGMWTKENLTEKLNRMKGV